MVGVEYVSETLWSTYIVAALTQYPASASWYRRHGWGGIGLRNLRIHCFLYKNKITTAYSKCSSILTFKKKCQEGWEKCIQKFTRSKSYGLWREKTCLWVFANNKGADQPVHPPSLISTFVIRFLKSVISYLATSEIQFSSLSLELSRLVLVWPCWKPRRQVLSCCGPYNINSEMSKSSKFPKSGTLEIQIFRLAGCLKK